MKNLFAFQCGGEILRFAQNDMKSAIYDRAKYTLIPVREDMNQLRQEMNGQIQQLRVEIGEQVRQLRVDMNAQFDRMVRIMLGILAAFAALVATTIGFALWDRRTLVCPCFHATDALDAQRLSR